VEFKTMSVLCIRAGAGGVAQVVELLLLSTHKASQHSTEYTDTFLLAFASEKACWPFI
jgi:hypothetical protein